MPKLNLSRWDSAEYLKSEEDIAGYLQAVADENDPVLLIHALGVVARARGMTQMARDTGITRESLYRALAATGNPEFATVMKVARALGLGLAFKPMPLKPVKRRRAPSNSLSTAKI